MRHGVIFNVVLLGGHIGAGGARRLETSVYIHVLRQIDFLNKALATNLTNTLPFTAVDLYVSAAEAGTLEHFGAEVTMEGIEACVYFQVVIQAILSLGLLATFRALCVVFILYVCFSTSSCATISNSSSASIFKLIPSLFGISSISVWNFLMERLEVGFLGQVFSLQSLSAISKIVGNFLV